MKNIYVVFPWVGNAKETADFLQNIFTNMLFTYISKAEVKRRELAWNHQHYKTFRFLLNHYSTIFTFTEEEFELIYLPLCGTIVAYYEADVIDELTKKIEVVVDEYRV